MPTKNRNTLATTSGNASFFSCGIQAGRDEGPDLVQHIRQGNQEGDHQRHLHRHEEGAGHVGGDHLAALRAGSPAAARPAAYRCRAPKGTGTRKTTSTATSARISRSRSSTRWEMKAFLSRSSIRPVGVAGWAARVAADGSVGAVRRRRHRQRLRRRGRSAALSPRRPSDRLIRARFRRSFISLIDLTAR